MAQLMTTWRARTAQDGSPETIIESHMVPVGGTAYFRKPGVHIANLGQREAGIFLRADGALVSAMPMARVPGKVDAAWIAKTVLTETYVKSCGGIKLIRMCACQYGICGHCKAGRHDKCATRVGFEGKPPHEAATHIVDRKGGALNRVWPSGKPCTWVCPCTDCPAPEQETPAVEPHRQVRGLIRPGDTVWLTPKTIGAPAVCWSQPRATVVKERVDFAYMIVRVGDTEHRVHVDNVRHTDPRQAKPATPKPRKAKAKPMPDGYTEVTLF